MTKGITRKEPRGVAQRKAEIARIAAKHGIPASAAAARYQAGKA